MFHVEQEQTSIFKNSLTSVRLCGILSIVLRMMKLKFLIVVICMKNCNLEKRKQLPEIWQLSEVPREF